MQTTASLTKSAQDPTVISNLPWDKDLPELCALGHTIGVPSICHFRPCKECGHYLDQEGLGKKLPDVYVNKDHIEEVQFWFQSIPASPGVKEEYWTDLMKAIVRYSFMAYGFGCWDRVAVHLAGYGIKAPDVHWYAHQFTKLTSFTGFMGVHLDIDDLAFWVSKQFLKVPQHNKTPYYTTPQLFMKPFHTLDEKVLAQYLGRVTIARFGLNGEEIELARGFFNRIDDSYLKGLYASRTGYTISQRKTVKTFLEYEYPNGHKGVYPLDTHPSGILKYRNFGIYGLTSVTKNDHYTGEADLDKKRSQDELARLAIIDSTFENAYGAVYDQKMTSLKRVASDPQQAQRLCSSGQVNASSVNPPVQSPPVSGPVTIVQVKQDSSLQQLLNDCYSAKSTNPFNDQQDLPMDGRYLFSPNIVKSYRAFKCELTITEVVKHPQEKQGGPK